MVGLSLVGGKSSKLRSLVAVLLVCSSVVSHTSAGMLRELVGEFPSTVGVSSSSVVQTGAEAQSQATTPASTPSPTDSVDPDSPASVPSSADTNNSAPVAESIVVGGGVPAAVSTFVEGSTLETPASEPSLTPSPFLQNAEAALSGGASLSTSPSFSPTEASTEITETAAPTGPSPLKSTLSKTTKKPSTNTLTTSGSGSSSSPSSSFSTSTTSRTTAASSSSSLSSSASGSSSSATMKKKNKSGSDDEGNYKSGSGSTKMYACGCESLFKVSLMGQSDYCLAKSAKILNKCGNVGEAESGECPRRGAMPCADTGHVLANDSICVLDDRDGVYKCVASREDLKIMQNGGKKKKKSNLTSSSGAGSIVKSDAVALHRSSPAFQAVTLIVSVALGIAALV